MRHDKIVAEVLLLFSVVHVAVAAPAVVRQGHLDVGGAASEKRVIWDDEPPSLPRSGPAGFIQRTTPVVPTPLIIHNPEDDETESDDEPLRVPQSRLKGSTLSTSGSSGLSPGLPPQLPHPEPVVSDTTAPLTSPASESLHLAQPGTSGPHLMYSPSSSSSVSSNEWFDSKPKGVTWAPEEQLVRLHDDTPVGSASNELPKPKKLKIVHWAPEEQLVTTLKPAPKEPFLTEELKQKMKDYAVLGTVAGVSLGLLSGMQKEIMGTVSPGAQTVGRDLASSDVNGRGSGPLLHGLPDHFRPRKSTMVRGLASLRDEDLRFLSVLTRRALESLD